MAKTPLERMPSAMVGQVSDALNKMPAPSLQLTLRMMVNLQRAEIKGRLNLGQGWEDICLVFISIGYSKANPKTIARYYYGDPPKKLSAVKAALAHSSPRRGQKQHETKPEPSQTTEMRPIEHLGTGLPVIRGPIL